MIRRALAMAAVVGMALASLATAASATNDKVTLCHNGHTITISENALKGHFDHEGQPARGHENDYLGECIVEPPVEEPPVEEPPVEEPPVEEPPAPPVVVTPEAPVAVTPEASVPVAVVADPPFTG
jgi:hypothetical protein